MRMAIADPPYLHCAQRYYGIGGYGSGYGKDRADEHPNAKEWDQAETHKKLVHCLKANYDAWCIAMSVHSIGVYAECVDLDPRSGYRFGAWVKPNGGIPSGSRISTSWEPVLFYVPQENRKHGSGIYVKDFLAINAGGMNFMGAKPSKWTRWVLDVMGYDPETDTVDDLFPGSGAVSAEVAQGVLI